MTETTQLERQLVTALGNPSSFFRARAALFIRSVVVRGRPPDGIDPLVRSALVSRLFDPLELHTVSLQAALSVAPWLWQSRDFNREASEELWSRCAA